MRDLFIIYCMQVTATLLENLINGHYGMVKKYRDTIGGSQKTVLHLVAVYSDLACQVTPALLCSTLLRRSRWTCASAVVYHNLVC